MKCKNCSYIKEELDKRVSWYKDKRTIWYNTYKDMTYGDIANQEEEYCWCEKVGGKIWQCGICDDAYSQIDEPAHKSKKKRRTKRERDLKYKRHLEYISKNSNGYPSPAYPVDKYGIHVHTNQWYVWFPDTTPQKIAYYKRWYRSNNGKAGSSRYHKKMSNRKIRRYKGELPNGFGCHKLYNYWYEMY